MSDPLLSTLCRICYINPPKYKCPRCSMQTCSLTCSKRHKVRASCNGVRDPTIFKPMSELATPSGVDHDYNFIHSIEHKIERSEKEIVEDRGLVKKEELQAARSGNTRNWGSAMPPRGDVPIQKKLREMRTRVDKAPKGMKRNIENSTRYSFKTKCISWQVEWIREDGKGRMLAQMLDKRPLAQGYSIIVEEERLRNLSSEEKRLDKKRKAMEHKQRVAKKAKLEVQANVSLTTLPVLQDPVTTAWLDITAGVNSNVDIEGLFNPISKDQQLYFYLLRPYTPSIFGKVLIPLDRSQPLKELLRHKILLEFPTIYIFSHSLEDDLPDGYVLEKDFLAATGGQAPPPPSLVAYASDDDQSDDGEDETSSDESDQDEGSEEGEIV